MLGKPPISIFCNCVYCEDIVPSVLAVQKLREVHCVKIMHIYNSNLDSVAVSERMHGFTLGADRYFNRLKYQYIEERLSHKDRRIFVE